MTRGEKKLQTAKIVHLKIKKYFTKIYFIPTFELKKDAFKQVLKKYKLNPRELLVVGDRIEEEIKDAHELGCPTVLVRRPNWPVDDIGITPELTVRSLKTLQKNFRKSLSLAFLSLNTALYIS